MKRFDKAKSVFVSLTFNMHKMGLGNKIEELRKKYGL